MRRRIFQVGFWLVLLSFLPVFAQEGYPLSGTWSGDWGASGAQRNHLTLVMNWDGKKVSGEINPGPDAIPLKSVSVDVTNWTVRIEADAKDSSGSPIHISAEGRLDDIGAYHRTIRGSWSQGAVSGDFRLTRD
ncbi:MAG TPA: hypothetical protein VHC72_22155 [Bryobacteraceae bacterium]|nr:hypothetical protein [Bryobacteraceae bacterium]